jgi:hypothetical protein
MKSGTSAGEAFISASFAFSAARSGPPGAYDEFGSFEGLSAWDLRVISVPLLNYLTKSRGAVKKPFPYENLTVTRFGVKISALLLIVVGEVKATTYGSPREPRIV